MFFKKLNARIDNLKNRIYDLEVENSKSKNEVAGLKKQVADFDETYKKNDVLNTFLKTGKMPEQKPEDPNLVSLSNVLG